jgi:hypothetical protein
VEGALPAAPARAGLAVLSTHRAAPASAGAARNRPFVAPQHARLSRSRFEPGRVPSGVGALDAGTRVAMGDVHCYIAKDGTSPRAVS